MIEIIQSKVFSDWLLGLKDRQARARIYARLDRMADGNFGDAEPIGEGMSEARIHYGPGYRLYFMQRGQALVVLLCGGDKSTQQRDIQRAKVVADLWKGENP
ncbi:type II toxin-antitoxin system RelE/ParE family toxin [Thiothrix unzii]|uniref:Type II toxin-antitoxin system RelE/ParE family toxin n=1 Tax=Thiothrix unzii TaxID=111769 RepID=A0A975F644_9GAMM|nr:type II toxin-antitoxin system RelE/ParE family toxin [Thiothrix unzii]QTR52105.1 type II toxin-antitoxin system RelE/ParE family toxin [Thiothrix unzii]